MTWILPLAMLAVTATLLLQGCAYLILGPRACARFAGAATIILAAIGYLAYALLARGTLVVSPEFDIAMVQGVPAGFAFAVILVGGLVAAGAGWHASRCARRPSSHALWILALSV
ncbi:MAG TPA: hypothetical protein VLX44_00875, partial [Xanthobacteraceae bacterium]|nr:hypothetical protein [Xanthobacteraceae bacterium]